MIHPFMFVLFKESKNLASLKSSVCVLKIGHKQNDLRLITD